MHDTVIFIFLTLVKPIKESERSRGPGTIRKRVSIKMQVSKGEAFAKEGEKDEKSSRPP